MLLSILIAFIMVISTSLIFIICMLTSGLCCNWLTDNSKLRNTTMVLIEVMVSTGVRGGIHSETVKNSFHQLVYRPSLRRSNSKFDLIRILFSLLENFTWEASRKHLNWLDVEEQQFDKIWKCLSVFQGGEFTKQDCLVLFPYKMYKRVEKREVESQLGFIRDSLKEIFHLYRYDNLSSTSWDPVKTMLFLESINRQIYELNSCIKLKQQSNKTLTRYYRKLKNTIQSCSDGRSAFWELLRKKTKHHLESQGRQYVRQEQRSRSGDKQKRMKQHLQS
ncbi:interferon phi 1 [Nothobranchius furzeri]|uniref:interferon phi 1 n=1 Tax=Nothobranchius furzeri TaxID=105023 RepID=UPI003904E03D